MSDEAPFAAQARHPAPHRGRVGPLAIGFAILGAPTAWALSILIGYGLISGTCGVGSPGAQPLALTLAAVNLGAAIVAVIGGAVAGRSWMVVRHEPPVPCGLGVEIGEGRTRFIALAGLLTSAGFAVVIAFDALALMLPPVCGP